MTRQEARSRLVAGRDSVAPCKGTLAIAFENRPGLWPRWARRLGLAGVSIEGGGALLAGSGLAHFLVADGGMLAQPSKSGYSRLAVRDVITVRLNQTEPGQLERSREEWLRQV